MKLLEITRSFHPSVGGLEKFVADRLKIYKELDINYKVLSTNYSTEKKNNIYHGNDLIILPQYTPYNITLGIKKYLKADFDILSINGIGRYFSDYAIWYSHKKKKKIILTPHFTFHTKRFNLIKKLHSDLIQNKILHIVDRIICFTEVEKRYWANRFNFDSEKIRIIPHYFDEKSIIEESFNKKKYFLYLGRYADNKKIDLLIKVFNSIDLDINLFLTIKDSDLKGTTAELAKKDSRIKFLGTVSDYHKELLLRNCEALIYPTNFEAFGISLFEASKYAKPILASKLEVFEEILNSEGIIFFRNNENSLKKALSKFYNLSNSEKEIMGEKNYQNLKNYSYEKIKNAYKDLFNEFL